MTKRNWIIAGIVAVVALLSCYIATVYFLPNHFFAEVQDKNPQIMNEILELEFTDLDGNTVALEQFAGTPLVVNAWATWCPFCKKELPEFAQVQKEVGDDVIFIAVNRQESAEKVLEYIENNNLTNSLLFVQDPQDTFYKTIGGFSMPETLFITADGEIAQHRRGVISLDQLRTLVNDL